MPNEWHEAMVKKEGQEESRRREEVREGGKYREGGGKRKITEGEKQLR